MTTYRPILSVDDIDDDILTAAFDIVEGWYLEERIDWADFLDRLETWVAIDLGSKMDAPWIEYLKKKVRAHRKELTA